MLRALLARLFGKRSTPDPEPPLVESVDLADWERELVEREDQPVRRSKLGVDEGRARTEEEVRRREVYDDGDATETTAVAAATAFDDYGTASDYCALPDTGTTSCTPDSGSTDTGSSSGGVDGGSCGGGDSGGGW